MSYEKKIMKAAKKSGKTTKKERAAVWQYLINGDLGVGYYTAKQLAAKGFTVLKPIYRDGQPD